MIRTLLFLVATILLILVELVDAQESLPTVPIYLINAQGAEGVTCEEARELFQSMRIQYENETRVKLRLRWFECIPSPGPIQTLENRVSVVYWWRNYFKTPGKYKGRKVLYLALLSPIQQNGASWIAGAATRICGWDRSNTATATANGKVGVFTKSLTILSHETGHLIGATHDDSLPPTIMHSAATAFITNNNDLLHFSNNSIREIRACVRD